MIRQDDARDRLAGAGLMALGAALLIALAWGFAGMPAYWLVSGALAGSVGRVIDGDDLCLCGDDTFVRRFSGRSRECNSACVRVRLCGIDAPERGQPGYREAGRKLVDLTRGKATTCIAVGDGTPCDGRSRRFNRDRVVAQCFVGGADIACELVKSGHAKDWPKYSGGHYGRCP